MKKLWFVFGVALVVMVGCCGGRVNEELRVENERLKSQLDSLKFEKPSDLENFIDNTSNWVGDTVTLKLIVAAPVFAEDNRSLKNLKGKSAEFHPYIPDPEEVYSEEGINPDLAKFTIRISISPSLTVPRAAFGHKVIVTFVCEEGKLQEGNTALGIRRFRVSHYGEIKISPSVTESSKSEEGLRLVP